jgi:hypothetical protein
VLGFVPFPGALMTTGEDQVAVEPVEPDILRT